MTDHLCSLHTIKNLLDVTISIDQMNDAISFITAGNLVEDEKRLEAKKKKFLLVNPSAEFAQSLPVYGIPNRGPISEKVLIYLIQKYCGYDVAKIDLLTGKAGIGSILDFMTIYPSFINEKVVIIGWATTVDRDHGVTHCAAIRDGKLIEGRSGIEFSVTADNLSKVYYGVDETRLKAYYMKDRDTSDRKRKHNSL